MPENDESVQAATCLPKAKTAWLDLRCPRCNRWLGSTSGEIPDGLKIKLHCSKCKVECLYRNGRMTIPALSRQ